MYKLIIIDDHQYIINGIKSQINLEELDISFLGSANTGSDGIKLIMEVCPDIVIVDIELPDMTGIDIIKSISMTGNTTKFIILSGHSEFNYAQAAISLNVIDYLLKPVMPDKLYKTLKQTITILEYEKKTEEVDTSIKKQLSDNIPLITEKFIEELFSSNRYTDEEFIKKINFLELPFTNKQFRCLAIKVDYYTNLSVTSEYLKQTIELEVLTDIAQALKLKNTYVGFKNNISYYLVYFDKSNSEFYKDNSLDKILSKLIAVINEKYGVALSFYLGDCVNSYKDIRTSYLQARECIKKAFLATGKTVVFFEDIAKFGNFNAYIEPYNKAKLSKYIADLDSATAREYVFSILDNFSGQNIAYIKNISQEILCTILETIYKIERYDPEILGTTDMLTFISTAKTSEELHGFFDRFFTVLDNLFMSTDVSSVDITLNKIKNYIAEHYAENITLDVLANITYCAPSYISSIFAKKMDVSYKTYLTDVRMKKAYELLSTGEYKVYEVSQMVGYKKVDYFRKLFKQYFNKNPKVHLKP